MIAKYTKNEFDNAKTMDKLPCECEHCHTIFYALKKDILQHKPNINNRVSFCSKKCKYEHTTETKTVIIICAHCHKPHKMWLSNFNRRKGLKFCSHSCAASYRNQKQYVQCDNCGKSFLKGRTEISRYGHNFCSLSCVGYYSNSHRIKGSQRSKLEVYLETHLTKTYPTLEIHYNRKDAINSELDIYIPSLRLAFELNGAFHYEPIFGEEKLSKIKNNDQRKFQACIENGIEMCTIDTSSLKYFKPERANNYLSIINSIITHKIANQ